MNPHDRSEPPEARRWRNRFLALLLGLALSPVVLGCVFVALTSPVGGTEECRVCDASREAWGLGSVMLHHSSTQPADVPPCAHHSWCRTGCWRTPGGFACYGPP